MKKFTAFFDENSNLPPPVVVQGEPVSFVDNFVYLGSAIGSGGRSFPEINRRLGIASSVMNSLNRSVWRCRYLCRRTKIRLFRALVLPVLLYGSETCQVIPGCKILPDCGQRSESKALIYHHWRHPLLVKKNNLEAQIWIYRNNKRKDESITQQL